MERRSHEKAGRKITLDATEGEITGVSNIYYANGNFVFIHALSRTAASGGDGGKSRPGLWDSDLEMCSRDAAMRWLERSRNRSRNKECKQRLISKKKWDAGGISCREMPRPWQCLFSKKLLRSTWKAPPERENAKMKRIQAMPRKATKA